jgi:hypothetical protein
MRTSASIPASRHDAADFAAFSAASLSNNAGDQTTDTQQVVLGFLEKLFGSKPAELFVLIWLLRDKQSHWFSNPVQAVAFVERFVAEDVYVGCALSPGDFGSERRCIAEQTAGITALWGY